jgi:hypothetical protein
MVLPQQPQTISFLSTLLNEVNDLLIFMALRTLTLHWVACDYYCTELRDVCEE